MPPALPEGMRARSSGKNKSLERQRELLVTVKEPIRVLHLKSAMVRSGGIEKIILSLLKKSERSQWLHHVALIQGPAVYGNAETIQSDILTTQSVGTERLHYI